MSALLIAYDLENKPIAKLSLNFNFDKSLAEVALRSIHPTTPPTHPTEKV